MSLRSALVGVGLAVVTASVIAQTPEPSFEVAAIKRTVGAPADGLGFRFLPGGRFQVIGVTVRGILGLAYPADEQIGLPDWAQVETLSIDARGRADASHDEVVHMLRTLLKERLALRAHYETHAKVALALTVAGSGRPPTGLLRIEEDCEAYAVTDAAKQRPNLPATPTGLTPTCRWGDSGAVLNSGGMNMTMLASRLTDALGERVFDKTGLAGFYRFILKYRRPQDANFPLPDEYQDIPTALKDQLGLELKSARTDLDVIVIDHIEHPTEN